MTIHERLQRFNTVIFAIVGVGILLLLGYAAFQLVRSESEQRGFVSSGSGEPYLRDGEFVGDSVKAEGRTLLLYGKKDGDVLREAHFVDSETGKVTRFAVGNDRPLTSNEAVSVGKDSPAYGHFALAASSPDPETKRLDVLFMRFADMKVFTVISDQKAVDGPFPVGDTSFSLVAWNPNGQARFIVFDAASGASLIARDLPFKDGKVTDEKAPIRKYH